VHVPRVCGKLRNVRDLTAVGELTKREMSGEKKEKTAY